MEKAKDLRGIAVDRLSAEDEGCISLKLACFRTCSIPIGVRGIMGVPRGSYALHAICPKPALPPLLLA